jgi:hypothetical protein
MSTIPLANRLRALRVNLSVSPAGKLHVEAPAGTLTDELRATLTAHRDELLAIAWDDAAAEAAFAATLYRLRDVSATAGDQRSADMWEALNTAWFACDRAAFAAALAEFESYAVSSDRRGRGRAR